MKIALTWVSNAFSVLDSLLVGRSRWSSEDFEQRHMFDQPEVLAGRVELYELSGALRVADDGRKFKSQYENFR